MAAAAPTEIAAAAAVHNAYPELPLVAYRQTSVLMKDAEAAIRALDFPVAVKRAAYVVFRIESGNGAKGINNNFIGAQADGSRWPMKYDPLFTGVVVKQENKTGKLGYSLHSLMRVDA